MPIDSIVKSLSTQRLSTYQAPHLSSGTVEQSLGLYVWNKQLSGLFYPVLQVLEVSLRNAIYSTYIEHEEKKIEAQHPQEDWAREKAAIDLLWFDSAYTRQNNRTAFKQLQVAKNHLTREGKNITPDNLIAKLTFGFWVHMTDENHRIGHSQSGPIIPLWPTLTSKVFPNAKDTNGNSLSINSIHQKLLDVNLLRNRIAHHEPIWKSADLFDSDDAINKVIEHYDLVLSIIGWINPNCLRMLSVIENDKLMGIACSQHTLWRSKMLTTGITTVPDLEDWKGRHEIDTRRIGEVVSADANKAFIRCQRSGTTFYTSKNLQNRKRAWPLTEGAKVSFIPKPGQPRPKAHRVKPA
ncbi:TPA: Abi family protein [Vibrio vulnificus]|uniref:Abi family protein n=1 Tax=Vibrio TaxID=662 RepID=UPI000D02E9D1|nr:MULTISPECIES: Abi family protein [Vibrio]EGR1093721.1 hypothetical protein [Vibrio cholerae]EID0723257.1 Abi family protein [Vibrio parahaemolyticus]EIJ2220272.1 Abi family protein [Vibrio cholerae]EJL6997141.1 Abi family protein [Vibrio cholerae]EKF9882030.1 Abi family protein [Vibrio cholerae]